jgi:LmbE family N-acetylglucosaminyl deacetylase
VAPPLDVAELCDGASRVVVLAPHPDDEVLGVGGLMSCCARRGVTVEIVAVTDGEAALPSLRGGPEILRALRRQERAAALASLGLDPSVHELGLPDGAVEDHEAELVGRLGQLLDATSICVSPWRRDGHPDHDATGRAAVLACRARGARLVEYPIWAWHWATPAAGLPVGALRRLELSAADRARKAEAIERFTTQIRPVVEAPDDEVVLPPAVLERFGRSFETFLVEGDPS